MARFTTLYSGSSGNCACVEENGKYILIDMGKSCRTTVNALKQLGLAISDLCGILITHEHSDHVSGLRVFLSNYNVPVYGAAETLDFMLENNLLCGNAVTYEINQDETIGDFTVQSYETSHDSVACRGYRITTKSGKIVSIATDLGFVSDEVLANLYLADLVCLEANYDFHMLMTGSYPLYLKKRIDSKRGHLCNDESAETVSRLVKSGCKKIALCHLSRENNEPSLVYDAIKKAFLKNQIIPEPDCTIYALLRHEISPWMEL